VNKDQKLDNAINELVRYCFDDISDIANVSLELLITTSKDKDISEDLLLKKRGDASVYLSAADYKIKIHDNRELGASKVYTTRIKSFAERLRALMKKGV
jgi:hypothetical protein